MSFDVISNLELQAREENREYRSAFAIAKVRALSRFGSLLNQATTPREFEDRYTHIAEGLEDLVAQASEEHGYEGNLLPEVKAYLKAAADIDAEGESPVQMPAPPPELEQMMALHQNADPQSLEKLRQFYLKTFGQEPISDEQRLYDPNFDSDMNENDLSLGQPHDSSIRRQGWADDFMRDMMPQQYYDQWQQGTQEGQQQMDPSLLQPGQQAPPMSPQEEEALRQQQAQQPGQQMMAAKEDDKKDDQKLESDTSDKDKSGDPKHRPCPTCRAAAGEDCKGVNATDKVGKGETKFHDTRKKGHGSTGEPVVKLMRAFEQFVAAEDGDSYEKETIDVEFGGDPKPEPEMNKGEWNGLPPIDVPSVRNPTENQSVYDLPDWDPNKHDEGWNDQTTERIDATQGIGEEQKGEPGGVFPNTNQADPVTAAKKVSFDPEYDAPPRGWDQGPQYQLNRDDKGSWADSSIVPGTHKFREALDALRAVGVPEDKAMQLINQYQDESQKQMTQENTEDPYGMSQGLDKEDLAGMHTVGRAARWSLL